MAYNCRVMFNLPDDDKGRVEVNLGEDGALAGRPAGSLFLVLPPIKECASFMPVIVGIQTELWCYVKPLPSLGLTPVGGYNAI